MTLALSSAEKGGEICLSLGLGNVFHHQDGDVNWPVPAISIDLAKAG